VKEQQTKETLPFTIKEANNDIKDESVKGWHVQITDTENAKVVADYPGLVVVRAKKTQYDDNVYLIGKSGIVQTFVVSGTDTDWDENEHIYDDWERTTSYSSVDAIWRLSYKIACIILRNHRRRLQNMTSTMRQPGNILNMIWMSSRNLIEMAREL